MQRQRRRQKQQLRRKTWLQYPYHMVAPSSSSKTSSSSSYILFNGHVAEGWMVDADSEGRVLIFSDAERLFERLW